MPFHSCHPRHIKVNLPYNLARRICTIVDDIDIRNQRLKDLEEKLKNRENPSKLIQSGIEKAKAIDQTQLRECKPKVEDDPCITFVHTHNPNNPNIWGSMKNALDILNLNQRTKRINKKFKFINSRRQAKNLKGLLAVRKFDTKEEYGV